MKFIDTCKNGHDFVNQYGIEVLCPSCEAEQYREGWLKANKASQEYNAELREQIKYLESVVLRVRFQGREIPKNPEVQIMPDCKD